MVVQTWNPDVPCIRMALDRDEVGFYRRELSARRRLGYPPFTQLVRLLAVGEDAQRTQAGGDASGKKAPSPLRGGRAAGPGTPADVAGQEPVAHLGRRPRWREGPGDRGAGNELSSSNPTDGVEWCFRWMSTRYRSDDMDKSFAEIRTLGRPRTQRAGEAGAGASTNGSPGWRR